MRKTMKSAKPQEQAPSEPFAAVAQRLGEALAAVVAHPNCPDNVHNAIVALDTDVFNHFPDIEISLRHSFPKRLVGMLERPA